MKQTIEIEVPEGKKAVWKDNTIVFEDIKPQLPKTWEEFCKQNPIKEEEKYIDSSSNISSAMVFPTNRNFICDRNVLPSKEAAEQHLALMQLHQLRDCYRQGWIPDWKDSKNKICIKYYNTCSSTNTDYTIIIRVNTKEFLSFQSRVIAEEFLNNFKDLIEQAGDLI